MQKDSGFFDDLAKMMTGAAGGVMEMRREFETLMTAQVEKMLRHMNLVTREEFDAVKTMAARITEENEIMRARLDALEAASKTPHA